jgi:hypothetical protein
MIATLDEPAVDSSAGSPLTAERQLPLEQFSIGDTWHAPPTDPMELNLYSYCKEDPVNGSDPTGHFFDFTYVGQLALTGINAAIFTAVTSPVASTIFTVAALIGTMEFAINSQFREDLVAITGGDLTQIQNIFAAGVEGAWEIGDTIFEGVSAGLGRLVSAAPVVTSTSSTLPTLTTSAQTAYTSVRVAGEGQAILGWITPQGAVGFAEATPSLGGHADALARGVIPPGSRGFSAVVGKDGDLLLFNPMSAINPPGAMAITADEAQAIMKALPKPGPTFHYVDPNQ